MRSLILFSIFISRKSFPSLDLFCSWGVKCDMIYPTVQAAAPDSSFIFDATFEGASEILGCGEAIDKQGSPLSWCKSLTSLSIKSATDLLMYLDLVNNFTFSSISSAVHPRLHPTNANGGNEKPSSVKNTIN